jgi:hypothetical protein
MATTQQDYPVAFSRFVIGTGCIVECVDGRGRVYGYLRLDDLPETHLTLPQRHLEKLLARFS